MENQEQLPEEKDEQKECEQEQAEAPTLGISVADSVQSRDKFGG